jgi:DNA repair ATPase RecN
MITKIGIVNFQSIEQLGVECGPITVFVGESDSGKSAVVRALYAAAFNDYPSDHVRSGAGHSMVVIATDEGVVRAEKGKAKNEYEIKTSDLKRWSRVGRDVPEEVSALLGFRQVELDDGTKFIPSIQRQFDGPFLLSDSPSKVAKILGSLTNISTLFAAIREGTNEARRLRRAAEEAAEEAERHEESRRELEPKAEALRRQYADAAEEVTKLEALWRRLNEVGQLEERIKVSADRVADARVALNSLEVPQVDWAGVEHNLANIDQLTALEKILQDRQRLVDAARVGIAAVEREAQMARGALRNFMDTMQICPLCERPFAEDEVHG